MSKAEFGTLIDDYIDREAAGHAEMSAEIFVDLLLERSAAKTRQPLHLEVTVVDHCLVITPNAIRYSRLDLRCKTLPQRP